MKCIAVIIITTFIMGGPTLVQKPKSDAEDEGLKGNIKIVNTETADLSNVGGKIVEGPRKRYQYETYDTDGNLVENHFYDYMGNLSEKRKYSYIDGERVSKHEFVFHEYNPPFVAPSSQATKKKWDSRYDWMYKYKHDANGNRIEETIYNSDGSLWIRDVTKFDPKGNAIEWARYAENGSLNTSSKSKYDEKGNEIEKTYFNPNGSVSERYSYTYEFDQKGNWIKQVGMKWVTKEGKSYFEMHRVKYRKISYN